MDGAVSCKKRVEPAPEIMECTFYNRAAFQRSIAALYERRRVAQQYGCFAEVGLYYEPGEKWKQHDELLYKFGFDVPLPRVLQNENRAACLRVLVAELPEFHRATDAELSWYAGAPGGRKDYDYHYHDREYHCCDCNYC